MHVTIFVHSLSSQDIPSVKMKVTSFFTVAKNTASCSIILPHQKSKLAYSYTYIWKDSHPIQGKFCLYFQGNARLSNVNFESTPIKIQVWAFRTVKLKISFSRLAVDRWLLNIYKSLKRIECFCFVYCVELLLPLLSPIPSLRDLWVIILFECFTSWFVQRQISQPYAGHFTSMESLNTLAILA